MAERLSIIHYQVEATRALSLRTKANTTTKKHDETSRLSRIHEPYANRNCKLKKKGYHLHLVLTMGKQLIVCICNYSDAFDLLTPEFFTAPIFKIFYNLETKTESISNPAMKHILLN